MTKSELSELLHSVPNLNVNEGISSISSSTKVPRVVYWDYIWEDVTASGKDYSCIKTYQISFFSDRPSDPDLIQIRDKLREKGLFVRIYHEYDEEKRIFHSYFSLEATEDE